MRSVIVFSTAILLSNLAAAEQDHSHGGQLLSSADTLGQVAFPISCNPSVQKPFERAVAMLHSFWYEASLEAFEKIVVQDPDCAMGYWGIAMSEWHPLWYAPDAAALQAGRRALEKAKAVGSKSNRERGFVDALDLFYRDGETRDNATRVAAYEKAMEQLHARFPEDREVTTFYGLALVSAASPKDKTYAKQKRAAVLLQQVFTVQPDHPGASHYLIHALDYPELAELGLPAARNYSRIAPAAPHALHMPSHIFTRLGLWRESIASNISSEQAAKDYEQLVKMDGVWDEQLHAMDYLAYAYLQLGEDRAAKAVLDELNTITKVQPENVKTAYAFAALPARYALERRNWAEAAGVTSQRESKLRWPSGLTAFTRGYGLARLGDLTGARRELAVLETIEQQMAGPKDLYWSDYIGALRRGLQGWIAHCEDHEPAALALMRSAADLEDGTEKHPVTPGSMLPMRELLGELLLEQHDGKHALIEYQTALRLAPRRLAGLYGAARAADLAGDSAKAKSYYAQMVEQSNGAGGDRAEIRQAREYSARERRR
jgi:tetratricopeptide (TPR) repeat protein